MWRELEDEAGTELLVTTGGIDYGDAGSLQPIVDAIVSAGVPHEVVDPVEAAARWPGFSFDGPVVHQPDAGRILADATVRTLQARAGFHGAQMRFGEKVRRLVPQADSVTVTTDTDEYRAPCAVVTAGAWLSGLVGGLVDLPVLTVTREQIFHFGSQVAANP